MLLPEDYKPSEEKYISATVVEIANDCKSIFRELKHDFLRKSCDIIVHRSMIEEINYDNKNFFLVLENHVVGILDIGE